MLQRHRANSRPADFELQRNDGSWLVLSNSVAWMDFDQNRDSVRLEDIPPGDFRSVRFVVGLGTNLNHADVAKFPAGHPLNPNLNGLHWSWQGGYIFLALEGSWRTERAPISEEPSGYSFHFARDPNRTLITVPLEVKLASVDNARLSLSFDVGA